MIDRKTENILNRYADKLESDIKDFYENEFGDISENEEYISFVDFFQGYNVSDIYLNGNSVFITTYDSFGYDGVVIELTKDYIRVELDGISMSTELPKGLCREAYNEMLDYCY